MSKQKSKKLKIIFVVVLTLITFNMLMFRILFYNYNTINKILSPDGKYVAIVFEGNSGATSRYIYRLSILRTGESINIFSNGNTYISSNEFDVYWSDSKTLNVTTKFIVHERGNPEIYKRKRKIYGITVNYF